MNYHNKLKNYMVLGCVLTGLLSQACGSVVENEYGRLRVQGQEIVNDQGPLLIKSIGMGNWMIQEGYMMQSTDWLFVALPLSGLRQLTGFASRNVAHERVIFLRWNTSPPAAQLR